MGFFPVLFLVLLGLYIFGIVVKLLFRMWIVRKARQFQQDQGGTFRTYTWGTAGRNNPPRQKPEGNITVEQTKQNPKRVSKSVGDYVDFEEVD